ncbi:MAG: thiamine-phosphate kinase [Gemmatimonadaceae bacterium]
MTITALGPGVEFDIIRRLVERWGPRASGIGDDAAAVDVPRGDVMIVSVDSAIEGQHLRGDWLSPSEMGYRAVAAALSDLAAMGARPRGVLIALGLPEAWRGRVDGIADGVGEAVSSCRTTILGGNLSAAGELSITTTVLGSSFAPLMRGGAKPGDHVYVTGLLGGPGAALARLLSGQPAESYRDRFAHPVPRLEEGRWLADAGCTAAIDISDGLAADARHVAAASGVVLELDGQRVPCVEGVDASAAVRSGEEYELLVTAPNALDAVAFEARFQLPLTEIGRVVAGQPGTVHIAGVPNSSLTGHDHFSR